MSAARAPRVLVLGTLLGQPMGGVRRHNAELLPRAAARLAERGGSLAVMEGSEPVAFALPAPIERIASNAAPRPPLSRWRTEGLAARHTLARARAAGRPFGLVHTGHLPAPGRLGCPFTITIHDLRNLDARHAEVRKRIAAGAFAASAVRRAARVFAVSEAVRGAIVDRFHVAPARVVVVPNAADHFEPLPRVRARDAEILYVGHLEPRKNLDVLLRALALDRALPPLVLAGAAKGAEVERLRALARELNVEARVRFLGTFDDRELPHLYARAACAVLPSRIEGFGIPVLEAARARVPLAIAGTPALVEVAGPDASVFAPEDPAACARALRSALSAPAEAIDRAARRASAFRWDDAAAKLVESWCGIWPGSLVAE